MKKRVELVGKRFGRLFVVEEKKLGKGIVRYLCLCDCGKNTLVKYKHLMGGQTNSCGCIRKNQKKFNEFFDCGDFIYGETTNTKNKFYFDPEELEKIKKYAWSEDSTGYISTVRNEKTIKLHRVIFDDKDILNKQIDHINGDRKDNRKKNLRIVSIAENRKNTKAKGRYFSEKENRWIAYIMINKKTISKRFKTESEAIACRKEMELKYFGEFSYQHSQTLCEKIST